MTESSSLFARSIYMKTPGGDTRGLPRSKCDSWTEMREIGFWSIYDRLRLHWTVCDPKMCVNLCVCDSCRNLGCCLMDTNRQRESWQSGDRRHKGQVRNVSIRLHRLPNIKVPHEFHRDAWINAGPRQVRAERLTQSVQIDPSPGGVLESDPCVCQILLHRRHPWNHALKDGFELSRLVWSDGADRSDDFGAQGECGFLLGFGDRCTHSNEGRGVSNSKSAQTRLYTVFVIARALEIPASKLVAAVEKGRPKL
jgi:hypothetical protein